MKSHKKIKRIDHLIRYFVAIGALVSFGYISRWEDNVFLFLAGPLIYIAAPTQHLFESVIGPIKHSLSTNLYGFLMPITIIYYGVVGFLLKQLWNEQGATRIISMLAMIGFLIFIHYTAWQNLTGYFTPII